MRLTLSMFEACAKKVKEMEDAAVRDGVRRFAWILVDWY